MTINAESLRAFPSGTPPAGYSFCNKMSTCPIHRAPSACSVGEKGIVLGRKTMPDDREITPQQAQKNGQSAITQDAPLRELCQDGDAGAGYRAATTSSTTTPELTNEEVAALCDIGRDGKTKPGNERLVKSLVARGFIASCEEGLIGLKLTSLAQETLGKRGVGLNES